MNDCSTDGSPDIIREYMKWDTRIRLIQNEAGKGAGAARNWGFTHAVGKYVIFLDSDDYFSLDLLEKTVSTAETYQTDIVAYNFSRFFETGKEEQRLGVHEDWLPKGTRVFNYKDCPDLIMSIVNPTPWNKLYRAAFISENNLRFEQISTTNDITFAAVSVATAQRVSYLRDSLVHYRVSHGGTITSKKKSRMNNVLIAVESAVSQVSGLPYYPEIKNAAMRFAIDNLLFALENYGGDPEEETTRQFYISVHEYFQSPLFEECTEAGLHYKMLYACFCFIRDTDYPSLMEYGFAKIDSRELASIQRAKINGHDAGKKIHVQRKSSELLDKLPSSVKRVSGGTPSVVVSFTSFPQRIFTAGKIVRNILRQTVLPDEIHLYLAESQFPNREKDLPESLLSCVSDVFSIHWCPEDLRSHKKYFYVVQERPNDIVILVDDDMIYRNDMIELLLNSYIRFPYAISTLRTHLIMKRTNGEIAPYEKWVKEYSGILNKPSMRLFSTTGAGTLLPPFSLSDTAFDSEAIKRFCLYADDIWLKVMQVLENVPVVLVAPNKTLNYIEDTQTNCLFQYNVIQGKNDVQLSSVIQALDPGSDGQWIIDRIFADGDGDIPEVTAIEIAPVEKTASRELAKIRASWSYRIGRMITWLPRKVRGGIRCYQEHDLRYTLWRVKCHLTGRT